MSAHRQNTNRKWVCFLSVILLVGVAWPSFAQSEPDEVTPEVQPEVHATTVAPADAAPLTDLPTQTATSTALPSNTEQPDPTATLEPETETPLPTQTSAATLTPTLPTLTLSPVPTTSETLAPDATETTLSTTDTTATPTPQPTNTGSPTATTSEIITPVATEPTLSVADMSATPISQPTITSSPTLTPPNTLEPIATQATLSVTDTTATPTPQLIIAEATPASASIQVVPDAATPAAGIVSLTVWAESLPDVLSVVVVCQVDAAVMQGVTATSGVLLAPERITALDNGFQSDGQWALAAMYQDYVSGIQGSGPLWHLTYQVIGSGPAFVGCTATLTDQNGHALPSLTAESTIEIQSSVTATTTPPAPESTPDLSLNPPAETPSTTPTLTPAEATAAVDIPLNVPAIDVEIVAAHYGLSVPPADPTLDLNQDGLINIYDLVLASADLSLDE